MSDVFLIRGSASQVQVVRDALAKCTFPFDTLASGLKQSTGKSQIDVSFKNMGFGVGGLASEGGWIRISNALDAQQAQEVFLMEAAHTVDFYSVTPAQRQQIYNIFHPAGPDSHSWFEPSTYWNQVGEAFMYLFVWAYSDLRPQSSFIHKPTEQMASRLRDVLGGGVAPPNPPPPPQPPQPPQPNWLHRLLDRLFNRH